MFSNFIQCEKSLLLVILRTLKQVVIESNEINETKFSDNHVSPNYNRDRHFAHNSSTFIDFRVRFDGEQEPRDCGDVFLRKLRRSRFNLATENFLQFPTKSSLGKSLKKIVIFSMMH